MITTITVAGMRGTPTHVEFVAPSYARAWKQRPFVPVLAGFSDTDNSTGVSEVEYRHR